MENKIFPTLAKRGNKKTDYFHKQTNTRMCFNFIKELKDNNNKKINGKDAIKKLVLQHFNLLYSDSGHTYPISQADILPGIHPNNFVKENEDLEKPITDHEIIEAICTLHPDKSLGLDGFTINFYRVAWDIIEEDLRIMLN